MATQPGLTRHTTLGFVAVLLWSAAIALMRSLSEQVGPLTAGAAAYLLAGALLGGRLLYKERSVGGLRRLPRLYLFGCGSLFVINMVAIFLALGLAADRHQSIEVALLNYFWPVLTIILSLVILNKRARIGLVPGTLLALMGIVLVLTEGSSVSVHSFMQHLLANPMAYGFGVAACVSWALYSNLTVRWGTPNSGWAVFMFIGGTGMAFLLIRLFHAEATTWSLHAAGEVVALALITALGYLFWDIAMREGDAVLVMAGSYLTPFLATVMSCLYLGVTPGLSLWAGCLLLIAGSWLSWRSMSDRGRPAAR